VTDTEI